MLACYLTEQTEAECFPIYLVDKTKLAEWLEHETEFVHNWVEQQQAINKVTTLFLLADEKGRLQKALKLFDANSPALEWVATLPWQLPEGHYVLKSEQSDPLITLGWGLGAYQYTQYKKSHRQPAKLLLPSSEHENISVTSAVYLTRDLINTPPQDMMPQHLSETIKSLANEYQAEFKETIGQGLLDNNFPAIHSVGRASVHPPRLLELVWGDKQNPLVTLVGKGVCYDTGGLNIKPGNSMRLMKKDMGGAANLIGLSKLVMATELPIRLHLIIPAVDNAISGDAFRPGDIITMRNGMTVEVDNTDAEGRLILADALSYASENKPDLLIDFATLTGAARVAVGTEIAAFFSNAAPLAAKINQASLSIEDPCWQLPLFKAYRKSLETAHADLVNCANHSYAGASIAALFLQEFIGNTTAWLHFDIMAWNTSSRPAHPVGGEAMGIRTVFDYLQSTYKAS
jgi:leucyl aminopeptidase